MSATMFADPSTGEVVDVKQRAAELACDLLEYVWAEVSAQYPIGGLTALQVAQKVTNAVLGAAVKEHFDILAEPMKPKQTKLDI